MKSNNANQEDLLLYAVTDRAWLNGETLYEQVEKAIKGGTTFVQLREKQLDEKAFLDEAVEIQSLCKKYNVPFVINDNVDIAVKIGADGVHVGQSDMEAGDVRKRLGNDRIIGVSAQTVEQAVLAQERGADYLGVGAVFPTGSKDDADDVSKETLKAICEAVDIPVIAIGGISNDNVLELSGSGICGIAVISAIFAQKNIEKATAELKEKTKQMINKEMYMVEGIIFDVDGTILDSMIIWMDAGKRYLEGMGHEVHENLGEIMFDMTMPEAAEYMKMNYGLTQSIEEICDGINAKVYDFYANEAKPKENVQEFLEYVYSKNIPMVIATSTDRPMIEVALKRTGFDKYFKKIFTTTEIGAGKSNPKIFEAALSELKSANENTWLFEDAVYSVKTAKSIGIKACGIYDFSSDKDQDELMELADIYIKDWNDYKKVIGELR